MARKATPKGRKGARKMSVATEVERDVRRVRLDLSPEDYERLVKAARNRGLNLASYARQAVLTAIKADEGDGK